MGRIAQRGIMTSDQLLSRTDPLIEDMADVGAASGEASQIKPGQRYAVEVTTDELSPRYERGEFIILDPNAAYEPGDYVMVEKMSGGSVIGQLLSWSNDKMLLIKHNPQVVHGIPTADIKGVETIVGSAKAGFLARCCR